MRTIVIIIFFTTLWGMAFTALKPSLEVSGFWEYVAAILNIIFISIGAVLSMVFSIKWFTEKEEGE